MRNKDEVEERDKMELNEKDKVENMVKKTQASVQKLYKEIPKVPLVFEEIMRNT
jgi:hypothetical protein